MFLVCSIFWLMVDHLETPERLLADLLQAIGAKVKKKTTLQVQSHGIIQTWDASQSHNIVDKFVSVSARDWPRLQSFTRRLLVSVCCRLLCSHSCSLYLKASIKGLSYSFFLSLYINYESFRFKAFHLHFYWKLLTIHN